MARLVFAAHDPGAARMLAAIAEPSRQRGFDLIFLGAGPAVDIWRSENEKVIGVDADFDQLPDDMAEETDLLVTGTGFSGFEKNLWRTFRAKEVASLGGIDSWSNLRSRFICNSSVAQTIQPDAITVIDEKSKHKIEAAGWCQGRLFVVGQPHLEVYAPRIKALRRQKNHQSSDIGRLVFFSEPIEEDYGKEQRGFSQFEVAELIIDSLTEGGYKWAIEIKKHPRESADKWRTWVSDKASNVTLSERSVDDLLIDADGVLGMTTMSLIEASLIGIPALSLQPGRGKIFNPIIDDMVAVVTKPDKIVHAIRTFMTKLFAQSKVRPDMQSIINGSASRFIGAIEKMLVAKTVSTKTIP